MREAMQQRVDQILRGYYLDLSGGGLAALGDDLEILIQIAEEQHAIPTIEVASIDVVRAVLREELITAAIYGGTR